MIGKLTYLIITFAASAIPLNIAVRLLEGKSSWLKAIATNIGIAILSFLIGLKIAKFAGLLSFLVLLVIYKIMFRLGWFRALMAWLLQLGIIAIFWAIIYWIGGMMLF